MKPGRSRSNTIRSNKLLAQCAATACPPIEALEARRLLTAWYVATTGAPSNNGSLSQPFAAIQQAANVAQPGDTVYIMGGVYHETVTPPTSGTSSQPITFEAYQGQSVTIDGADPITGWSNDQGSIYSAPQSWDLGEGNNEVFVDGTMVNEARWPNTPADVAGSTSTSPANISTPNWATVSSVNVTPSTTGGFSTVTIYNSSLTQPAGTWVGSIAHIEAGQEWLDQTGTITASAPGSITVSYFQETAYQVPQAGNRFYIVGNFKALDSAGEWYRDPASGKLYLWDPAGDSPANHTIEAKARDDGFNLDGVSNIDITGVNLFACTIVTDANSTNDVLNGITAQYVSQSIGITPENLSPWITKSELHTTGILLEGVGDILENSTIAFSSGDGVFLAGSGNTVENTVIHDVDYEAGDEAGISSLGSDETILNNTIYNAGRSGIVSRFTYDSLISHNVVHTVGLQTTDLGGIYVWGTNGDGTEISYNVVYNIHSGGYLADGIYLDNGSDNYIVDHNLVFDCDIALKLNPPSWDNFVVNNTFVGTQYGLQTSGNADMTGSVLVNNIFSGTVQFGSGATGATHTNDITSPINPGFVSTSTQNYQLLAASPAINAGIVEAPYTNGYTGTTPDDGAYEYGSAPFAAGALAMPFVPPTSPPPPASTPVVTWATPSSIGLGTALGAAQLDASSSVPGTFVYSPAAGAILTSGAAQTLSVTFTPTDAADYTTVKSTVTIDVMRATPTITWANPAAITIGTALGAAQLDATANIPGAFAYTPVSGTTPGLGVGQNLLTVIFTPTDLTDYTIARACATINVVPPAPTVTWASPAAISYGTSLSAAQLDATGSVPGTFVYTPSLGAVLSAGAGQTLSVTFTPTDTVDYSSVTTSTTINVTQLTPTITWPAPSPITFGAALTAAQLDAASSVPGTFVYNQAIGALLGAGNSQTLWATFTPADAIDYTTAVASTTISVTKATPTIAWAVPSSIVYGTALSSAQLNASSSAPGTFVYNHAIGVLLSAGNSQTLSVVFTPTDSADYTSATASTSITVTPATPTITWANPSPITYGTALGAAQLDATSPIAGTFVYTPAAGTLLGAGAGQTLSARFIPTDAIDYTSVLASAVIDVGQAMPSITWAKPAAITPSTPLGAAQLDASSSIPGTFVYSPSAGTLLSAGLGQTLSATFTPTDATDYATVTVSASIDVAQVIPTITWPAPDPIAPGTPLSAAQLDAASTVPGTFVYTPAAGAILNPGAGQMLSVVFTPTDAVGYTSATASVSIDVGQITPKISWTNPAAITPGTPLGADQLDASSAVAGTFAYSPAAGTYLNTGAGQTLSVVFTPTDTVDYAPATATVTIDVAPLTPTITWVNPSAITYGTAMTATQLDATSNVPGSFAYTPAVGTMLGAGNSQTLSVTFTPTDSTDYTSTTASTTIDVTPATPTLSWVNPAAIVYGTALSAAQLDATSSIPGTFTYAQPAGSILHAGAGQALSVRFSPADSLDYASATATATITVQQASPVITWSNPASISYGTALSAAQLDATSSVAGTFAYTPAAGTVLHAGNNQSLSAIFTPADSTDYSGALASTVIDVKQAVLTATAANLSRAYGAANPSLGYLLSGFVNGDNASAVTGAPSLATSALASSAPGSFPIALGIGSLTASDYSFILAGGVLTVTPAATSVSVVASAASTTVGQSVTFTATVIPASGAGPTGTVQFKVNGVNAGSPVTLASGKASYTTTALAAGTQSVTAVYSGNADFAGAASSAISQAVAHAMLATTTTLSSSSITAVYGQWFSFTAKVTGPAGSAAPTGTITFKDGATVLKTITLSGGAATLAISSLSVASHTITAVYSGDANYAASTSKALVQIIKQSSTSTALSSSASTVAAGQALTLTVVVAAVTPGVGVPTGVVTFKNGSTLIGTATLSGGKATVVIKTLPKGTDKLTASYAGDGNFLASLSAIVTQTIS